MVRTRAGPSPHDASAYGRPPRGRGQLPPAALPLPSRRVDSIAVIGGDADWAVQESGAGAVVNPTYQISPLEGIRRRAGGDVDVQWSPGRDPVGPWTMLPGPATVPSSVLSPPGAPGQSGLRAEYFAGTDFTETPLAVRTDPQAAFDLAFVARFAANPRLVLSPMGARAGASPGRSRRPRAVTTPSRCRASGTPASTSTASWWRPSPGRASRARCVRER
jgi:beta-glucosidase